MPKDPPWTMAMGAIVVFSHEDILQEIRVFFILIILVVWLFIFFIKLPSVISL